MEENGQHRIERRLLDDQGCRIDAAMLDEACLGLRDELIARVRVAHRGRRRSELPERDGLIYVIMQDVIVMMDEIYGK